MTRDVVVAGVAVAIVILVGLVVAQHFHAVCVFGNCAAVIH